MYREKIINTHLESAKTWLEVGRQRSGRGGRHVENKARVGHCVTWLQGHVAALRFLLDEKLPSDPDVSGRTLMHEAGMGYGMLGSCERSGILKISFKLFQDVPSISVFPSEMSSMSSMSSMSKSCRGRCHGLPCCP